MADSSDRQRPPTPVSALGNLFNDLGDSSAPPREFPGYEVLGRIGAGGMGEVWRARDVKLGRHVAIKTIKGEVALFPNMKERFLREARSLAQVKSDHVVVVHHVGETAGAPYVVMELLEGESLQARLGKEPGLTIAEVVSIGVQACAGLDGIHRAGLVHRDIKPNNLWLENRDGDPPFRLKVLDFGLVRSVEGDTLTASGAFLGTPAYMSPEQAAGLPVEAASDLFSLGCVLYQCVCRQRPFGYSPEHIQESSLGSWQPIPIERLRPEAPPALVALINRLLARNSTKRPKSARHAGDELTLIQRSLAASRPKKQIQAPWFVPAAAIALVGLFAWLFLGGRGDPSASVFHNRPTDKQPSHARPAVVLTATLPEWAKGRPILRVGPNETHRTIQSALANIEDGQAIELVGAGPFREALKNARETRDIGLFSRSGAIVELPEFSRNEQDPKQYDAVYFGARNGVRLSGIEFRLPSSPADGQTLHGMNLSGTGEIVVEDCVFWQPSRQGDPASRSPFVLGLVVLVQRPDDVEIRIHRNLFRCGLAVMDWDHKQPPSRLNATIERNAIVGTKDALWLPFTQGRYLFRENVVWALENAIGLGDRDKTGAKFELRVENNTFIAKQWLYSNGTLGMDVGTARFLDNLVVNGRPAGIEVDDADRAAIDKKWVRKNNWYAIEPSGDDSLPMKSDERETDLLLKADHWTKADFGQLYADSPAARAEAGKVAGAIPLNPGAGDWLSRLLQHPAAKP
jgi:serine/threonine protein kinase